MKISAKIGIIAGILLLTCIILDVYSNGFVWSYVVLYLFITFLQLVAVDDDETAFRFLTGLNIPMLIFVYCLFKYVDFQHKDK